MRGCGRGRRLLVPGLAAPVDARPPHAANCPPLHPQAAPGIIDSIQPLNVQNPPHTRSHCIFVHISEQFKSSGSAVLNVEGSGNVLENTDTIFVGQPKKL